MAPTVRSVFLIILEKMTGSLSFQGRCRKFDQVVIHHALYFVILDGCMSPVGLGISLGLIQDSRKIQIFGFPVSYIFSYSDQVGSARRYRQIYGSPVQQAVRVLPELRR